MSLHNFGCIRMMYGHIKLSPPDPYHGEMYVAAWAWTSSKMYLHNRFYILTRFVKFPQLTLTSGRVFFHSLPNGSGGGTSASLLNPGN